MKHQTVNVTEFKAKCLSLLDEIGKRGGTITITKRGRPLATVGPAKQPAWKSPEGALAGKGILDEKAMERDLTDLWECVREDQGDLY